MKSKMIVSALTLLGVIGVNGPSYAGGADLIAHIVVRAIAQSAGDALGDGMLAAMSRPSSPMMGASPVAFRPQASRALTQTPVAGVLYNDPGAAYAMQGQTQPVRVRLAGN
jgi:hypothetical protein